MKFLIFALAIGAVFAVHPGFLQNTPEVQAATLNFIREYNRLAKLAADAPDIHIYHDDNRLQRVDLAPVPHIPRQTVVNPLSGLTVYSFTANLGGNKQFHPHQIRTLHQQPQQQIAHVQPVHHQFVHQPIATPRIQTEPVVSRWTGPLAHSIPAGVHGIPQQVGYTPEVAAARNAHFQALLNAYQTAAAARHPRA